MAPASAIEPSTRNLMLWLSAAALALLCVAAGPLRPAPPGIDGAIAPDPARSAWSDRTSVGILNPALRIPVVIPDLAPKEIYLPCKIVAPPILLAAALDSADRLLITLNRKRKRPRIKNVNRFYRELIDQAANRHGIEPALIKAIIMAESGFDPNAVSNRGAKGLMQLMPQTAESLGLADAFDPGKNIEAGVRYFRQLLNHFNGDTELALAAYNAGIQKVLDHKGMPPYQTTRSYVEKVLTYYWRYKRMFTG